MGADREFDVEEDISIEIFTNKDQSEPIKIKRDDVEGFKSSHFNRDHKTVIFIHGIYPVTSKTIKLKNGNTKQIYHYLIVNLSLFNRHSIFEKR